MRSNVQYARRIQPHQCRLGGASSGEQSRVGEEAFDPALNPIRAKVSLGMRVLNVDDVGFDHKGGSLFMSYLRNKEQLATRGPGGALSSLGISGV